MAFEMTFDGINKSGPKIILVAPQLDQNLGKVARAMLNFGLWDLRLVSPQCDWLSKSARALSAGADGVLEQAKVYPSLEEATADLGYVLATTVRPRDMIKEVYTPRQALVASQEAIDRGQGIGYVFGPEKCGLDNRDIALCNAIVTVPLNPAFSSLNLAQAVVIMAYEWYQTQGGSSSETSPVSKPKLSDTDPLATKEEIHGLVIHLDDELKKAGYYRTAHKRPLMLQNLSNLFHRFSMTRQEVRTLRGVVSTLVNPHGIYSRMTRRRAEKAGADPKKEKDTP